MQKESSAGSSIYHKKRDWRVQRTAHSMIAAESMVTQFCELHVLDDSLHLISHTNKMKRRIKESSGIDSEHIVHLGFLRWCSLSTSLKDNFARHVATTSWVIQENQNSIALDTMPIHSYKKGHIYLHEKQCIEALTKGVESSLRPPGPTLRFSRADRVRVGSPPL